MKIKVMIVDDEPRIRLILRKVIEQTEDFEVIAECGSRKDALRGFSELKPDVVFMDVDLQGNLQDQQFDDMETSGETAHDTGASAEGIECARIMMDASPDLKLIFATASYDLAVASSSVAPRAVTPSTRPPLVTMRPSFSAVPA